MRISDPTGRWADITLVTSSPHSDGIHDPRSELAEVSAPRTTASRAAEFRRRAPFGGTRRVTVTDKAAPSFRISGHPQSIPGLLRNLQAVAPGKPWKVLGGFSAD